MIALQKGGVGKTEETACLAFLFALAGLRVLVIELDAQGDCAYSLGVNVEANDVTVLEVLYYAPQGFGYRYAVKESPLIPGVSVIPANWRLTEQINQFVAFPNREYLLARALVDDGLDEDYDVVLLDCPPAFSQATWWAAAVSHVVEIPLQLHNRAWRSLPFFESGLNQVLSSGVNPNLALGGLTLTMKQAAARQSYQLEQAARDEYGAGVYTSVVPFAAKAAEAPLWGKPVVLYDPHSPVALAYDALAKEMIARYRLLDPVAP
jgi:chromosome partitioning protein